MLQITTRRSHLAVFVGEKRAKPHMALARGPRERALRAASSGPNNIETPLATQSGEGKIADPERVVRQRSLQCLP